MDNLEVVGKPASALKGQEVVTGRARYCADLRFPGMLVGRLLYTRHPCAEITRLDVSRARRLPGVAAVLTHQDIPGHNSYNYHGLTDQPLLAAGRVYYQGDALAAVAAESEAAAQAALQAIEVEYRVLPGIYDVEQAMQPGALQVWLERPNIYDRTVMESGSLAQGFAQAEVIIEQTYTTQLVEQAFLETECAVALVDPDGNIVVYESAQAPHRDRMQIARALGIPESQVRVIVPRIGGAFGGKDEAHVQIHAALLAQATGRPVRIQRTREESMLTHCKRHPLTIRYRSGALRDGRLTAVQVTAAGDTGPYVNSGQEVMGFVAAMAAGPYRVPHARLEGITVFTNNPASGAMRGFGIPQIAFAYERQMDELARRLEIDPLELRLRNGLETGDRLPSGVVLRQASAMKAGLQEAARLIGWERRRTEERAPAPHLRRGWGVATTLFSIGLGKGVPDHAGAGVEMARDGSVILRTGATDMGQGTHTALAQIAAEALGVELSAVRLIAADTDQTVSAGSSVATRQIVVSGNAVLRAAQPVRRALLETAAEETGLPLEVLDLRRGQLYAEGERLNLGIPELAWKAYERDRPLHGEGFYAMQYPEEAVRAATSYAFTAYTFSTQMVKLLVDIETGQIAVEHLVAVHEAGQVVNPRGAAEQLTGGAAMGLGYALLEELVVEHGRTRNPTLRCYLTPTARDVPRMTVKILEYPEAHLPYGAKGLGEPVLTPTAAAVANAVRDATGARLDRLPLTPERVLEAIDRER